MAFIPSPPVNGIRIGPAFIHVYGLMYVAGITLAIWITRRRWRAAGGDPSLVGDVAVWAVPAGIIGGRIYFDLTTPMDIRHVWYGPFAVWSGGLGIWGAVALAAVVGAWRVRRRGADVKLFMDAVAPALLVAQAIGRIGNYFNQELFGRPTSLPWGLQIARQYRPAGYAAYSTFQPTFLYELVFDLVLAAALVWLGHHRAIRPPGLFALYVTGYSAFRIFEETLRIDSSQHFLGLRLNFYIASALALFGIIWFARTQRGTRQAAKGAALLTVGAILCTAATACGTAHPARPRCRITRRAGPRPVCGRLHRPLRQLPGSVYEGPRGGRDKADGRRLPADARRRSQVRQRGKAMPRSSADAFARCLLVCPGTARQRPALHGISSRRDTHEMAARGILWYRLIPRKAG